uniref:Uncharacterized protein n=1 Tax=Romanomermis culicivorax TaxID=13658 RepID=A0A915IV96_ROMCU
MEQSFDPSLTQGTTLTDFVSRSDPTLSDLALLVGSMICAAGGVGGGIAGNVKFTALSGGSVEFL